MHTDYVIWDPINYFLPPPHSCIGLCGGAVVGRCYGYVTACILHTYVAYMWCVYGRIELLRILRMGAPACGAHPPCLALPASEQNPFIEYKNKTNSDTTATITNQTAHRLYSYTLHNIYYRTL